MSQENVICKSGAGLGPGCGPCSRERVGWGFLEKHRRTTPPPLMQEGVSTKAPPSLTPSTRTPAWNQDVYGSLLGQQGPH